MGGHARTTKGIGKGKTAEGKKSAAKRDWMRAAEAEAVERAPFTNMLGQLDRVPSPHRDGTGATAGT